MKDRDMGAAYEQWAKHNQFILDGDVSLECLARAIIRFARLAFAAGWVAAQSATPARYREMKDQIAASGELLAIGDWLTVSSSGDRAQVVAVDGDNLTLRHPGGTTSVYDIAEFDGRILTVLERPSTPARSEAPPSPSPSTETPDGP
jgi:hypothetical protein